MTKVRTPAGRQAAHRLIESLRVFGGDLSGCPVWLFEADPLGVSCQELASPDVQIIPLAVPEQLLGYEFGDKVCACARAEELAADRARSLAWIDLSCLVVNPPAHYLLDGQFDAAVRPVHIRNVGLRVDDPLDAYWRKVYETVGVKDIRFTVESFVDCQPLRAYFNTHSFAINPAAGLLRRWLACFERLVVDQAFQAGACTDVNHRVFLHQAVFSALLAAPLDSDRIRILPPGYNYPYNLQASLPHTRRAKALNDLVTFTYEDRSIDPAEIDDIEVHEPLRSWLSSPDGFR
jgi:hypothetical protein